MDTLLTREEAVARLVDRHGLDGRRPLRLPTADPDGRYPVAVIDGWHNPMLDHRHHVQCPGLAAGDPQSHLAAIGLLALLAEQRPELEPRMAWGRDGHGRWCAAIEIDGARLWTTSSERWAGTPRQGLTTADTVADEIVAWLLYDYRPTPAINAWNGGSGLGLGYTPAGGQKSSTRTVPALDAVAGLGDRTTEWADTLAVARDLVAAARAQGWSKTELIIHCHNRFPDPRWVAACWTLRTSEDGDLLVPDRLLGTGGNIGSGDLGAITARRVLDIATDPRSEGWLIDTLTGATATPLIADTAGHLAFPGLVNPWRWLLAVEGLIAVASIGAWMPGTGTRLSRCLTTGSLPDRHGQDIDIDYTMWLPIWDGWRSWRSVHQGLASWLRWRGHDARTAADALLGNVIDDLTGWAYPIAARNGQNHVVLAGTQGLPR
ncbi:hypothetical protein [Gordonia sp. N1V]|uniref:hypothetical protein n=1 Tax=Gordonia sp. N1V TaxID=3034163 RepID=UPI0023E2EC4C|nr:hypothetical protein [Gordonia sp. N1V]MDF3284986.1 hypothetical protein [Gordonia sp. N1V]